ncbi:MAG TPA: N,N-dimethylformamidase beta subunit family domain-containing protein, partial [Rhodothermales bacterium]|nr:N,N-dimethylformamidase beta subunit family domain-containing protein [Rhodothermales bacterium]
MLLLLGALMGVVLGRAMTPLRGYPERRSYAPGEPVSVMLSGPPGRRTLRLRDAAGRVVDSSAVRVAPQSTGPEPWARGFGWRETLRRPAPQAFGWYCWDGHACFAVRDTGAVVQVVYPTNTVAAYSQAGGKSLYVAAKTWRVKEALRRLVTLRWGDLLPDAGAERARVVSFHRPVGQDHAAFQAPFFAWLAREGFGPRTGVLVDADLERGIPAATRVLVVAGHSEYWTRRMREAFDAFVTRGGHALVLSGNTAWWQARLEGDRLVVYRDAAEDPMQDPELETVQWNDSRLAYPIRPSLPADFPHGGFLGQRFRLLSAFARSVLSNGVTLGPDSSLRIASREMDGVPWTGWARGHPVPDTSGFYRFTYFGYSPGSRFRRATLGAFVAAQRTHTSGVVVHAGSTDWCGENGWNGPDSL